MAILGSLAAGSYGTAIGPLTGSLPPEAAAVVRDSVAGASAVAAAVGGAAGDAILGAARQAFVDAMGWTSLLGAGFALAGASLAFAFLPDRVNRAATLPAVPDDTPVTRVAGTEVARAA